MRPSLYDVAGGEEALLRLSRAHNARCLADPELNHAFSHGGHPQHDERLAAYWGEVLGGPASYTELMGTETDALVMHAGNGDMSDLGRRFVSCFVLAMDDAGLPDDAEFRAAMRSYLEWAVERFKGFPDSPDAVPPHMSTPRWSWDGLVSS